MKNLKNDKGRTLIDKDLPKGDLQKDRSKGTGDIQSPTKDEKRKGGGH